MASGEMPSLSIRHGVRVVPPEAKITVEDVLLAAGDQRFACPHYKERTQGFAADSALYPETDAGEGGSEQAQRTEAQGCQVGNNGARSADFEAQLGIVHGEGQTTGSETPVAAIDTPCGDAAEDGKGESRAMPADVAAGKEAALSEQPTPVESGVNSEAEDMDDDSDSDSLSVRSDTQSDMYTLDQINEFLNETFGKPVKVKEYFPDINTFIRSCAALQKNVGLDVLDEKKRFRLRKHVTALRKSSKSKRGKAKKHYI
ncbi:hypothetical protein SKAU_G00207770 [Synaphobranchus kaupii]|uniref:Uncharacterized protein n=1 Tax=Synaphobranchus kaupii TaxID=118154 RepID=A0A9Q1F8F5_SYNKA|nr:hypothetical protein SKAU_G00207770 [Synaphobranchus kaupii]